MLPPWNKGRVHTAKQAARLEQVLSCCSVYLTETERGVLTLFSTGDIPITSRNAGHVEVLLRTIDEHDSIKYFCFRVVNIDILHCILGSLAVRSDVRRIILNNTGYNGDSYHLLGSYDCVTTFPSSSEGFKLRTPMTTATVLLSMVRKATSLEVFHIDQLDIKNDDGAVELGVELAKKRSLRTLSLGTGSCTEVSFSYVSTLDAMQSADKDQACNLNSLTLWALCAQSRMLYDFWLSNIAIAHENLSICHNDTGVTAHQRILYDEVVMLANTLSRNSNVEVVVLGNVSFSMEGSVALGRLMVTNTAIRTIDISGSSLGTAQCIALADGLRLAKVLQELSWKIVTSHAWGQWESVKPCEKTNRA
ncbi:uncharacterized protein LOC135372050 [Ornithodoros turicata]|uniref:uncharacterized protein LOC135372050 n=1 Tax=Ornithodoros turicata TaxID=34597 RepID=UPI003139DBE1